MHVCATMSLLLILDVCAVLAFFSVSLTSSNRLLFVGHNVIESEREAKQTTMIDEFEVGLSVGVQIICLIASCALE